MKNSVSNLFQSLSNEISAREITQTSVNKAADLSAGAYEWISCGDNKLAKTSAPRA